MDFSYSEEQRDIQNLAREILSDEASHEHQTALEKQGLRYDKNLWATLAQTGLLGLAIEENYGGMGFGFTELCLLIEEVGQTVAPVPVIPALVSAALPLQQFGTTAQKARLLPGLAKGELLLSAALMEKQHEDPTQPLLTTALADGDSLRLNGQKLCVPFADQAERILLAAKTPEGVAVVLLDPKAAGVSLIPLISTTREPQFELLLNDVRVDVEDIISLDQGAEIMHWTAERTMAAICAMQLGVSEKAMRMTAKYTSERQQFGVPIATFQAVAHRAADCYIDVDCLRLVTQQAVSLLAENKPATTEVQIAKIWAGDTGHRVSYASQHLHGGMGIDREYPLWRYCLWAKQLELTLGSSHTSLQALGQRMAAGEVEFE